MKPLIIIAFVCTSFLQVSELLGQAIDSASTENALESYLKNFEQDDSRRYYIQDVVHAEGYTKDQLYSVLKMWFSSHFDDTSYDLETDDREGGMLIGRGWTLPGNTSLDTSTEMHYSIRIEIRDDKYRFRIYHVEFSANSSEANQVSTGTMKDLIRMANSKNEKDTWNVDSAYVSNALQSLLDVQELLVIQNLELTNSDSER